MATSPRTNQRLIEKFVQTIQQQPKPLPLKCSYASFLEDFVDPLPPKRYRLESIDSFVTQWLESSSESESYRERHCRSDTLLSLSHSDGDGIPRRLTKSVPNMNTRDADGFALPPTPASTGSRYAQSFVPFDAASSAGGSSRSSGRSLVENPYYRSMNLAKNNIYIRPRGEEFPEHIATLVDRVSRDCDSPSPSTDQVWQDTDLDDLAMGTGEPAVENYLRLISFPILNYRIILNASTKIQWQSALS